VDDAEHQLAALQQLLHRMGNEAVALGFGAREDAIAHGNCGVPAALLKAQARLRRVRLPPLGHRPGIAAIIHIDDAQHRHLGHPAHLVEGAPGCAVDQAFIAHVAQQPLQRDLVVAAQPERLCDLALARRLVRALDEIEDLFAGGKSGAVLGHALSTTSPRT
jgi:hypothetical protein